MTIVEEPYTISVQELRDSRGIMGVVEGRQLPFAISRVYWLLDVPHDTLRGGHAHHASRQFLICTNGVIQVVLESLQARRYKFRLESNTQGLYLPPLYWGTFRFTNNARCLCFASDTYQEDDYIRDYREFQKMQNAIQNS